MCDTDFEYVLAGGPVDEYDVTLFADETYDGNAWEENVDQTDDRLSGLDDTLISADEHFHTRDDESTPMDTEERTIITKFMEDTCGCKTDSGNACSLHFTLDDFLNFRADFLSLTTSEQDVFVLALLRSAINTSSESNKFSPTMKGYHVCMPTFLYLNALGKHRFYNLLQYYKVTNTLAPRFHGNCGRLPKNTCQFEDVVQVKSFLINYAEDHAVYLPGSYPNLRNIRVQVFDCSKTKQKIWEVYSNICRDATVNPVSYTQFVRLWNRLVPHLIVGKPRTDLCDTCQKNQSLIGRTINTDDTVKLARLKKQEEHLYRSERARLFYKQQCLDARELFKKQDEQKRNSLNNEPCSFDGHTHISFDYAQQLHIPCNPDQPGPMYFLTPRKIGLFGINNEAKLQQVNYLIDEGVFIEKGANTIISLLHHYCGKYGLGEKVLHIHADNCVGQNKNNFLIQYFMWRILTGKHRNIMYSFMIAGHTKFSCDRCFGLIKRVTKRTHISSICDVAKAVDESSPKALTNLPEIIGLENGKQFIRYYDWKSFLGIYFKNLPEIVKYHHFEFSSSGGHGDVLCREYDDSESVKNNILITPSTLPTGDLPTIITPKGLSKKRKAYLAKEIRPYCTMETRDLVAPLRNVEE